ncbi:MAG: hypothetical protein ACREQN_11975 [Candidatus Binataceae bacterium]
MKGAAAVGMDTGAVIAAVVGDDLAKGATKLVIGTDAERVRAVCAAAGLLATHFLPLPSHINVADGAVYAAGVIRAAGVAWVMGVASVAGDVYTAAVA